MLNIILFRVENKFPVSDLKKSSKFIYECIPSKRCLIYDKWLPYTHTLK